MSFHLGSMKETLTSRDGCISEKIMRSMNEIVRTRRYRKLTDSDADISRDTASRNEPLTKVGPVLRVCGTVCPIRSDRYCTPPYNLHGLMTSITLPLASATVPIRDPLCVFLYHREEHTEHTEHTEVSALWTSSQGAKARATGFLESFQVSALLSRI